MPLQGQEGNTVAQATEPVSAGAGLTHSPVHRPTGSVRPAPGAISPAAVPRGLPHPSEKDEPIWNNLKADMGPSTSQMQGPFCPTSQMGKLRPREAKARS